MKQLLNYINEALIKKDTKIDIISNFLIFIPWNDDYTKFKRDTDYHKENNFYKIDVIQDINGYYSDTCWIIHSNKIKKIKPFITDRKTKLYYIPEEYSKNEFIKKCEDNKISMKDIRKYKEYEITE